MLKSTVLILCTLLSSALAFAQEAELSFDHKVHKFDKVEEGEQLEHVFPFTNTGDAPLIITKYDVECVCTKAFFPKEPILPGESAEVRVTFDTEGKIGWQYRTIKLYSNSKNPVTEIELRVKVK
ncbi:DUF1573 domain-containing protein [Sanyastnella coralliicola]|uniref:DUF1573 domain-containing protein n=1 Tax=Sanyastnella coralliicola TaxID=3069118 RepID=UPI0027BA387B|nr:DUF1573 domain-containing protein [Longitalea sp. SCSIO 12813]